MDGVLCNFNQRLVHLAHKELGAQLFKKEELTFFRTENLYPEHLRDDVGKLSDREGFYQDLEPISGAVVALQEMVQLKYQVFICTSPKKFYNNPYCAGDKHRWVMKHLGKGWTERIILTWKVPQI